MPPTSSQRSSKRPALLLLLSLLALPSMGGVVGEAPEPARALGALGAWCLLFGYAVRCAFVEGGRIVRVVAVLLCFMFGSAFAVGVSKSVEKRRVRATESERQLEELKHTLLRERPEAESRSAAAQASKDEFAVLLTDRSKYSREEARAWTLALEVTAQADERLLAALDRLDAEYVLCVPVLLHEPDGVANARSALVEYKDASAARIAEQPAVMKRLASRVAESGAEKRNVDALLAGVRRVWPQQRALLEVHVEASAAYLRYVEFVDGEREHFRVDDEGEFEIEDEEKARQWAVLLEEIERRENALALAQEALIAKVDGR